MDLRRDGRGVALRRGDRRDGPRPLTHGPVKREASHVCGPRCEAHAPVPASVADFVPLGAAYLRLEGNLVMEKATGRVLEHIVWNLAGCSAKPCGAPPPDIPWYMLQTAPCVAGPPFSCGPGAPDPYPVLPVSPFFTTAPYTALGTVPTQNVFNPNFPAVNPNHSNVTRYWPNALASPPSFVIRVDGPLSNPVDRQPATPPQQPRLNSYTWGSFVTDVTSAFAKWTTVPTAAIGLIVPAIQDVSQTGLYNVYDPVNDTTSIPPAQGTTGGIFIWASTPGWPFDGPTGNGVNEILMISWRQTGSGGLCSMLADPTTGQIIEADVIFDVTGLDGILTIGMPTPIVPGWSNSISHEIGHALGMGHTNLHAGTILSAGAAAGFPQVAAPLSPPATGNLGGYGFVLPPGVGPPLFLASEHPAMTSAFMRFNSSHIAEPIHPDDAVGISRIYPVSPAQALANPGYVPLGNNTATVRGYLRDPAGRFDIFRNVVTSDPLPWQTNPTVPSPVFIPRMGTLSGLWRGAPTDVVGMLDTITLTPGSGGFEVVGIPTAPTPLPPGLQGGHIRLAIEALEYAGHGNLGGTLGEWFSEPFLNTIMNGWAPGLPLYQVISNTTFPLALRPAPALPSLAVVEGTVIEVAITDPAPAVVMPETVSRPLIAITPAFSIPPPVP